jgi:hypothetical protein
MKLRNALQGKQPGPPGTLSRPVRLIQHSVSPEPKAGRLRRLLGLDEQGQSMVEFAFLLPVLLMIVTGICAFGLTLSSDLSLTSAIGTGGQAFLETMHTTSPGDACATAYSAVIGAAPTLNPNGISLYFNFNDGAGWIQENSCATETSTLSALMGSSTPAEVGMRATYPCSLGIYGTKFASQCQVQAFINEKIN